MSNHINNLIGTAKPFAGEVRDAFGDLSGEQLNWKPSPGEWSVGQCLDHLVVSNNLYLKHIRRVAEGVHVNNFFSKIPFLPGFVGKQIINAVNPDNVKKVKTFPVFEPSMSDIPDTIVEDFCANHEELVSLMEKTSDLNTRKIKIPTPLSDAVNVRLIDAYEILVTHGRRHFNQARRVTDSTSFPR